MLGCSPTFWHRSRLACGELITHLVVDCIHGHWTHTYPSLNTLLNHDRSLKAHFPDRVPLRVCQWNLYQIKRHFLPSDATHMQTAAAPVCFCRRALSSRSGAMVAATWDGAQGHWVQSSAHSHRVKSFL